MMHYKILLAIMHSDIVSRNAFYIVSRNALRFYIITFL